MFKRRLVLVAIDRATDVKRTMEFALSAAKAREADVHVIRAEPHRCVHGDDRLGRWALEPHDAHGVSIGTQLASILRSADDDGVRVQSVTLRGEPEHVIPAYAQLHQATMLVVASDYGSSRFWRSARVVDEVARRSPIPLLVVPKRQRRGREEPGLRRIVTPVDSSIASAVALRTAVALSRRYGARLTLVHALKDVPPHMVFSGSGAWEVVRRLPAQVEAVAERLRRKAAFFGLDDVDTEVATGVADGAILGIAARNDADLVVMGIAHRSWLDRLLFGSILRRLLRRATVPVLVVPVVAGAHTWPDEPRVEQVSGRVWTESAVDRVAA
jgi:nucleotide-binding universal stress UspA family protein